MRCIACSQNMILLNVVHDRTMMVPGYEHQTLQCSACGESEKRLTFKSRRGSSSSQDNEPAAPSPGKQVRQRPTPLCFACGKRMALVEAVPDNNMIVSGYEHQTLRCSTCRVSECRFIFNPGRLPVRSYGASPVGPIGRSVAIVLTGID